MSCKFSNVLAHFNPRSPHGERPFPEILLALRLSFQSTLPARGATRAINVGLAVGSISIHAPRTGSDHPPDDDLPAEVDFNPRSPHGERRRCNRRTMRGCRHFNPRSPHGERRTYWYLLPSTFYFNPRSPHGEQRLCRPDNRYAADFNPRSPHGERPVLFL